MPQRRRDPIFWISVLALLLSAAATLVAWTDRSAHGLRRENRALKERVTELESRLPDMHRLPMPSGPQRP